MSSSLRSIIVPLLLVLGIQCWLVWGRSDFGRPFQLWLLAGAVGVSVIPFVNRRALQLIDHTRIPSPRARYFIASAVAILATLYLIETAWYQGRNFQPKWQDELSYLVQFQHLASGRLWMPKHELADFFDSFQLIVDPVYASMYFPGAAMLYTPGMMLGLPTWLLSAAMCGIAVGLIYLIMSELLDGWWGLLAVTMVLGTGMFRKLAILTGGHQPLLMLEMLMIFSFLRWGITRARGWIIALGIFSGWAAVTRPLDAIVIALPLGIATLLALRGTAIRNSIATIGFLMVGAAPFLVLQLIVNVGITGLWQRTPFELYADRDYPGTKLGFHAFDPALRPASQLPQKQKFHDEWTIPAIQRHRPERVISNWLGGDLAGALADNLPHRLMLILLLIGLLGLTDRRRAAVWCILPVFVVAFSVYTFKLPHYAIIILPAVVLTALLGAQVLATTWARAAAPLTLLLSSFILILSITETAEVNRLVVDEIFEGSSLMTIDRKLRELPHKPAVVLFRFDPSKNNPHEEPVYNITTAWPDAAEVIRAHDLGARNIEIFRYYARTQPDRAFYLYDRGNDSIGFLGFASDLASPHPTRP